MTVTADSVVSSGGERTLTVNLTAAETTDKGIIAYQFDLLYDPKLIELQSAPCDISDTMSSGMTVICRASETGVLKVVVFGTTPIACEGTLLKLKFNKIGKAAKTSPLSLQNFMFNEGVPTAVTVK